jgi:thioredoxin 1
MWGLRLAHSSHRSARRVRAFCLSSASSVAVQRPATLAYWLWERRSTVARFPIIPALSQMSSAPAVTDASFEQDVLKSAEPVLVDFWAPWCGPCRMVAPIVDEIAKEYEGKIKVFKLNTDENPNVASQYGIRSIPTLMLFKGGQKVETVVGAVPKTTLSGTISKYL